jgi:hypothetical protein
MEEEEKFNNVDTRMKKIERENFKLKSIFFWK